MLQLRSFALLLFLAQGGPDESLQAITIFGESERTARRLIAVDELLDAKQWPEAIQELQRLIQDAGDDLVPAWTVVDAVPRLDRRHCRPARWLCHQRLAALPPEARALYRQRVDAQARKWLDEGRAGRDAAPLRRLVDQAFCCSFADQALDLLGDLAFERGALEEAERWWRLLAPAPDGPAAPLAFPDPKGDLAQARAKQLLARLFTGRLDGFRDDLEQFRRHHDSAEGHLAGRAGNYAAILEEELARPEHQSLRAAAWETFGGDASRNRVFPLDPVRLRNLGRPNAPARRVRLDTGELVEGPDNFALDLTLTPLPRSPARVLTPSAETRLLACHPVLTNTHVLFADARRVTAVELRTGKTLRYQMPGNHAEAARAEPDAAHTLTVAEGRVYARLGTTTFAPNATGASVLVCLELRPEEGRLKECWLLRVPPEEAPGAIFEGAPLVCHGRAYVARTRILSERARTSILCLDAETGKTRWQQEVCETDEFKQGHWRTRPHLLTWAGGRVVVGSHSGAIVALEADSGRRAWAVRYPTRGAQTANGRPSPRGLAPCLFAGGLLFAAPADYRRIFCLDPDTGRLLWESNPLEVTHLLGVAGGRLLFTALTPYPCVRIVDAATGRDRRAEVYPEEDAGLTTFGRGLLTGRAVLWPTADGLRVLGLEDLRPSAEFFPGGNRVRGNLVLGPNHLVAAERGVLSIYELMPERPPAAPR